MICFRDMTFCSAKCKTVSCYRNWNEELHKQAVKWWGSDEAPIAFSDFSKRCEEYQPND